MRKPPEFQTKVLPAHHRLFINGREFADVLDFDDRTYTIRRMSVEKMVERAFRVGQQSMGRKPVGIVVQQAPGAEDGEVRHAR